MRGRPKGSVNTDDATNYKDTGCLDGMFPSCLNCPLDVCRYEPKRAAFRTDGLIEQLMSEGLSRSTAYRRARSN